MANKQRGSLPPVLSTEETRVKPPEEEEAESPPDEPSWDPQRDSTQLLPLTGPVPIGQGVDDATPPVPRKIPLGTYPDPDTQEPHEPTRPIPVKQTGSRPALQNVDDSTRQIPRKTGARPALQEPDDSTRQIPRKTGTRPALQEPDDSTRQVPRKTGTRPALQDAEPDATRDIPRKSGMRPALQDAGPDATRDVPRKSGSQATVTRAAPPESSPLPWESEDDALSRLPTRAQPLPPIASGQQQALVSPPHGPPVLVPINTEPHYLAQAPKVPIVTQPNYVPPPPPALTPIVTAPHLTPSAPPLPAEPTTDGEAIRTTFSNKAAMVADLVKSTFARRSYGTAPYRLRIDEPDGPSTAGGLHARQPISLISRLESAPPVLVGWVDVSKKESQLRNYASVSKRHKARYNAELDINEEEYDRFLNELVETLFYGGIKILLLVPDEETVGPAGSPQAQAQAQHQRGERSPLGTLLLILVTFVLGVGVGGLNAERFASLLERVKAMFP
ncbi:hypothetical protein [Hyalangium minutum]|uniref:Uncharacterized protein n=1 Tax=Hyalangium minutum TaxID=394096 RepID=A0A085WJA1_9BACT|nr:hypothetical protein [Hyalangium minutum]KFE67764.1 hypothetical protein DB31_8247 [Hyalangium minutum]